LRAPFRRNRHITTLITLLFIASITATAISCGGQDRGAESASSGSGAGSGSSGTGSASSGSQAVSEADIQSTPELEAAVEEYQAYVVDQTDQLVEETSRFTGAVVAGSVEKAKETYAPARVHWERIEPIAATLGDLDPNIDAREGDVPDDEWRGFHRIEQALWVENTTEGL
jgi:iron uptake system component EfeO